MAPEHQIVTNYSTFAGKPIIRLEQVINLFHLLQCSSFLGAAIIVELEQFYFQLCNTVGAGQLWPTLNISSGPKWLYDKEQTR